MGKIRKFSENLLQKHQLCFVHIPKTAGTSFMDILHTIVGRGNLLHISPEVLNGYESPIYNINDFICLGGHFTFEIYKLLKKPPLFLTFLREPLARSISNFQEYRRVDVNSPFVKQIPDYEAYLQLSKMTLEDFIVHPYFNHNVHNLQTRMLGLSIKVPVNSLADLRPIADNKRFVSLELAKERLAQFMFVGIQEEFQSSLEMIAYQFGIFPLENIPKLNETKQKIVFDDISDSTINQLMELNDLDYELYKFGVNLFKERYRQMVAELAQAYTSERLSVKEMLSRIYWKQEKKTRNIQYNLDLIYPRYGWQEVEHVNDHQWIWSGPDLISTVDLPIDRSVYLQVQFFIRGAITPGILESLQIFVDNQPMHLYHYLENDMNVYLGVIPIEAKKENYTYTRFNFQVSHTTFPMGIKSDDFGARLLGFALNKIIIREPTLTLLQHIKQCYPDESSQDIIEKITRQYWKTYPNWFTKFEYSFDESEFPHFGWYPLEKLGEQKWIWSGPETTSTVDLPIDRANSLRVRFQVKYFIELDVLASLELQINGQHIHLIHTEENSSHFFTGIIPAEPDNKYAPTRFSFHVNRTVYPPGMTAESPGSRLLGIALSGIEITPA